MIGFSSPSAITGVTAALTVMCTILVILRFCTCRSNKGPFIDDWLCLGALPFTWVMAACLFTGLAHGSVGTPIPKDLNSKQISIELAELEWLIQLFQTLQLGLTKMSFIFLFRRIFVTHSGSRFSYATWAVFSLLAAWTVTFFFAFLFICSGQFDRWWLHPQTCPGPGVTQLLAFEIGFALSEVIIDFFIVLLPIPMIWNLQMNIQRKLAVSCIFALGTLAIIISIIRLVIYYQAKFAALDPLDDPAELVTLVLFWSMTESNIALIAACLPVTYNSFGKRMVEFIVRSAHSLFNLSSTRSSGDRSALVPRNRGVNDADIEMNPHEVHTSPIVKKSPSVGSVSSLSQDGVHAMPTDMANERKILAQTTITQTISRA